MPPARSAPASAPSAPTAARVVLVVGPEELIADRAVTGVVRAVRDVDPDADVRDLPAASLGRGELTGLTSPSLFGERKVVVVRALQDAGNDAVEELKGYVAAPVDDVTLVLTHAKGPRGSGVLKAARAAGAHEIPCAEVKTRRDRVSFVVGEFAARGRRATAGATEALLDAVGNDLRALAAAASQLCSDTEGSIDEDAVRVYYEGRAEASGFTVADRAVEGRTAEALLQLRYALAAGTDPVPIVAALALALRNIVKVASAPRGLREVDLARDLGMPPWKVRIVRDQMRGWDAAGVATALPTVAAADAAVKGAVADPLYALEKAVITIAGARKGGERR